MIEIILYKFSPSIGLILESIENIILVRRICARFVKQHEHGENEASLRICDAIFCS